MKNLFEYFSKQSDDFTEPTEQYKSDRILNDVGFECQRKKSEGSLLIKSREKTVTLSFSVFLSKLCSSVFESLKLGDFGQVEESKIEEFRVRCGEIWESANLFKSSSSSEKTAVVGSTSNGGASN